MLFCCSPAVRFTNPLHPGFVRNRLPPSSFFLSAQTVPDTYPPTRRQGMRAAFSAVHSSFGYCFWGGVGTAGRVLPSLTPWAPSSISQENAQSQNSFFRSIASAGRSTVAPCGFQCARAQGSGRAFAEHRHTFLIAARKIHHLGHRRQRPGTGVQQIQRRDRMDLRKDRVHPHHPEHAGAHDHNDGGHHGLPSPRDAAMVQSIKAEMQ